MWKCKTSGSVLNYCLYFNDFFVKSVSACTFLHLFAEKEYGTLAVLDCIFLVYSVWWCLSTNPGAWLVFLRVEGAQQLHCRIKNKNKNHSKSSSYSYSSKSRLQCGVGISKKCLFVRPSSLEMCCPKGLSGFSYLNKNTHRQNTQCHQGKDTLTHFKPSRNRSQK